MAFAALAFQGLAAAHRSQAGGRLNRGWLAAIYVLLIVPLSMIADDVRARDLGLCGQLAAAAPAGKPVD